MTKPDCAGVIKAQDPGMERLCSIIQLGPKYNPNCPYKSWGKGDLTQTEEKACDERGRGWRDAATSQGALEATKKPEKAGHGFFPNPNPNPNPAPRGNAAPPHLDFSPVTLSSDFWPPL